MALKIPEINNSEHFNWVLRLMSLLFYHQEMYLRAEGLCRNLVDWLSNQVSMERVLNNELYIKILQKVGKWDSEIEKLTAENKELEASLP